MNALVMEQARCRSMDDAPVSRDSDAGPWFLAYWFRSGKVALIRHSACSDIGHQWEDQRGEYQPDPDGWYPVPQPIREKRKSWLSLIF